GAREIVKATDKALNENEHVIALDKAREIYTTSEIFELEKQTASRLAELAARQDHAVDEQILTHALGAFETAKAFSLNEEQIQAVKYVAATGDLKLIQGHAGAGKSSAAWAIREAFETAGFEVLGAAPSAKAAHSLAEGSGIESVTVHRLLGDLEPWQDRAGRIHAAARKLGPTTLVLVDEAAMLDSRAAARLVERVHAVGAKLVMIGDTAQLPSVGPGAAFRVALERHGAAEIATVLRQREPWARDAAEAQRHGRAREALQGFADHGQLHLASDRDTAREAAIVQWEVHFSRERPGETLIVAATRADVRALNDLARAKLISRGELPRPAVEIAITNAHGHRVGTREVREGERIIFRKNKRELEVRNGDLATVETIGLVDGEPALAARLDDGRRVMINTAEYSMFDYGYATTVNGSQGATVEHCIAMIDSGSVPRREAAYVALSRARGSTEVIVTRDSAAWDLGELSQQPPEVEQKLVTIENTLASMSKPQQKESTRDFVFKLEM
ncbi:MAG: ATP-dependent RecD-like DNA helicase, partial [Candidatus Binataceae bacterium]